MTKQNTKLAFPKNYFLQTRQYPLTPSMIYGLRSACVKQSAGISFGPIDIKKSTSLIRRGLIVSNLASKKGKAEISWKVTPAAIKMLHDIGVLDKC